MLLAVLSWTVTILYSWGHQNQFGLFERLHVGYESSIPTLFSTLGLFAAGLAAWMLGRSAHRTLIRRGWLLVAALFAFMGVDEACQIHEMFDQMDSAALPALFHYPWVLPYTLLVIAMAALLLPFWLALPRPTRWGMALGGAVFVASALGMEFVENLAIARYGDAAYYTMTGQVMLLLEETGEMLGVAIMLRTMLQRLTEDAPDGLQLAWRHPVEQARPVRMRRRR